MFYRPCEKGDVEIIKDLIRHFVDVNRRNTNSVSPIQAAVNNNHIEVVRELLECDNIDIDYCNIKGRIAFYWARQKGYINIVRDLINHDADINTSDKRKIGPIWRPLVLMKI